MKHFLLLAVAALSLTGCKTTETVRTVEVPVPVATPVPTPCKYTVRSVERPKNLAIDLITETTPMDKDADYWRAYSLQLVGYILGLETAVADRDSALKVCAGDAS